MAAHLAGPRGESDLLSAESFERLHTPIESESKRYALGWGVARRGWGGMVLNHAGSNTMWYCVAWVSPDLGLAFLVTCNQGGDTAAKACDEVAAALIDRALQAGWSDPASPLPTPGGLGSGRPDPP